MDSLNGIRIGRQGHEALLFLKKDWSQISFLQGYSTGRCVDEKKHPEQ